MVLTRMVEQQKAGQSFHYRCDRYEQWSRPECCPVCRGQQGPSDIVTVAELRHSWVEAGEQAQGTLFGKSHVLSKVHSVHLYDLSSADVAAFMGDVQQAARALHLVTGAVKINYEIHGNTVPHLHVHLFPRYLDDPFPSAPIDYRCTEPSPYAGSDSFSWFVDAFRRQLYDSGRGSH